MGGSEIKFPKSRKQLKDIASPTFQDLFNLAVLRTCNVVFQPSEPQPRLFPTAETTYSSFFTHNDWEIFGSMESEIGRMNYTLSQFPERGCPLACAPLLSHLLQHNAILPCWDTIVTELMFQTEAVLWDVIQNMNSSRPKVEEATSKSDLITTPKDYDTHPTVRNIFLRLWHYALLEISSELAQDWFIHTRQFLEIYAFLRDPIGGLRHSFGKQVDIFRSIISAFRSRCSDSDDLSLDIWMAIVAQAAQESSFLAITHVDKIAYIHFNAHQQLPYIYIGLESLSRSEFSGPRQVLFIIEEILKSASTKDDGVCSVAPIAVATYPAFLTRRGKELTIIIDGNHRVTATVFLRFLAAHFRGAFAPKTATVIAMRRFCKMNYLGIKWQIDLMEVLNELYSSHGRHVSDVIVSHQDLVKQFEEVKHIPALLVQEESFHTVCKQRAKERRPKILLPMHQGLFNDERLGWAFPQAGQVHGRASGFKSMPLISFKKVKTQTEHL